MSKYDKFIENLKEEINNINIPNQSSYIKSNVQSKNSKKSFFNFRFFSLSTCAALVLITLILTMIFIKKESAVEPKPTIKVPTIASTIDDAYAFEIMAAGNFLYTKTTDQTALGRKTAKKTADSELKEITDRIHNHYLTIKQLLVKDKITYKIEDTVDNAYKNKMIIQPFFNSEFDLEYTIYFNKTKTIVEDEEELFDFEGIIIINSMTYQIEGSIETEDDEVEATLKVTINNNEYFVIEQEKESDEEEFIYTSFVDNVKTKEYALSYEIEDDEIEVVIEMKEYGRVEKLTAKIEDNDVKLKVKFANYRGTVEVIDNNTSIKYYFVNENAYIEKKLIKNKNN